MNVVPFICRSQATPTDAITPPAPPSPSLDEICRAAAHGNTDAVAQILDQEPDLVYAQSPVGGTPLHFAAATCEEPDTVVLLLSRGADVNARDIACGATALHYAIMNGCTVVAEALLERGADTDVPTELGVTPLRLARMYGLSTLAQRIRAAGCL